MDYDAGTRLWMAAQNSIVPVLYAYFRADDC
ncbi:MAG: hypothetical protein RLZ92_31 [Pseudomonadota bacterium]|jgi:hypothetical protein